MKTGFRIGLTVALAAVGAAGMLPVASAQNDSTPGVDVWREQPVSETRVTLPRGVVEAASAYQTYLRNAAAIRAVFRDGDAVSQAMNFGEAYKPEQLEEGVIAYAALIALEDETFVRGVQRSVQGPEDGAREADALLAEPAEVAAIPGADDAAALVGGVLRREGGQLFATGQAVKQSAYDVQHQAWSKQTVPDGPVRLARAKSLSATAYIPAPEDVSRLLQTAAEFRGRRSSDAAASGGATPAIQRGLALAALAVLGQARDEAHLRGLLTEGGGAQCMHMAKLNLYQCLAVAGPHYEDIFCLGQHALMDTGQCVADIGGRAPARMESRMEAAPVDRDAIAIPVVDTHYSR